MIRTINRHIIACGLIGTLLCVGLTACSNDSIILEQDVYRGDTPMMFSQASLSAPVTRAANTAFLSQGFMVNCWKGYSTARQYLIMDRYEVKYQSDPWSNLSKWDYVGTTASGYYQTQIERYWDADAFPYRFYAISPCPAHSELPDFKLTLDNLTIPTTVSFIYQTSRNGVLTAGAEPFMPAQVECTDGSNNKDIDLLNGNAFIGKDRTQNGATTTYDRYVALPFHHFTSKVRFGIYNTYKKETPADFLIYNIKVKVTSDGFITTGNGYTANLAQKDMLHGTFTETVKAASDAEKTLLETDDSRKGDLNVAIDRDHAYFCESRDGMLQIPQQGVKLSISFDVYGLDYKSDFTSSDGKIVYDKSSKTIHYTDLVIKVDDNESFDWESNNIYTYLIKVTEFYPLSIDFSAELTPWTNVYGSIDTNLEQ